MDLYLLPVYLLMGYLLGSFPSALIFSRRAGIDDIREVDSGTMGTYNVLRNAGRRAAGLTLTADLLKGALALFAARYLVGQGQTGELIAVYGAVIGHMFPVFAGFKGGKSLAVYCGSMLFISLPVLALNIISWLIFYKFADRIAVSSVFSFSLLPPLFMLIYEGVTPLFWYLLLAGVTIGLRHKDHLREDIKFLKKRL